MKTDAAHTQRSHVSSPFGKILANLLKIPASMSATNSLASCRVLAATSCSAELPDMQPARSANSLRFQHIGSETNDGRVLAYGPKVEGAADKAFILLAVAKALTFPPRFWAASNSASISAAWEVTMGFWFGENRW